MRLALTAVAASMLAGLTGLTGCSVETTYETSSSPPQQSASRPPPSAAKTPASSSVPAEPTAGPSEDGPFAEVVYVFMRDHRRQLWFCTGALVSKTTVVTAAHCLDTSMFVSYEIVAPLAANRPRVAATQPRPFSTEFENVANPDIGLLTLSTPITLSAYAELTDVTARVDAGEQLTVAAVVRTAEEPEAPLQLSPTMPLSSTADLGYEHGFGTPMFSNGGDSGAGLFLVENGARTHKLVGVARQPEPTRALDHFTRIDASVLAWAGSGDRP